jgi:hypothetical protein
VEAGGTLRFTVDARNVGDVPTDGSPIEWTVTLPPGATVASVQLVKPGVGFLPDCTADNGVDPPDGQNTFICQNTEAIAPQQSETLWLNMTAPPGASGTGVSRFAIRGGGGGSASTVDPTLVGGVPGFGIDAFDGAVTSDSAGNPFTQAGGHPYEIATSIDFNTIDRTEPLLDGPYPVEGVKDVLVDLPPGLVGDPTGAAECTLAQLANSIGVDAKPRCSPASQVGTSVVSFRNSTGASAYGPLPVFNIRPPADVPARFGFNALGSVVVIDASVRSGGDYGLSVAARNIPEGLAVTGTRVTFWGVPAARVHDSERACAGESAPFLGGPTCPAGVDETAFLRNPTSCTSPGVGLPTILRADSWAHPGDFKEASFTSHDLVGYPFPRDVWGLPLGPSGCAAVPFDPKLTGTPAPPAKTASPSGFSFDLSLPQTNDPNAIGQGDLKRAVVTLPAGVRVSPSSAHGLAACSSGDIALRSDAESSCPEASKVGSVTIDTPLLRDPLKGSVYLAAPHDNPFDSLLAIYIVANGPGTVVKLAGHVAPDPDTGRIVTTFDDNPQLPFSNLHLEFNGGSTAPLATPRRCGDYQVESILESWSGKIVPANSTFNLSHDGKGAACPPPHFTPAFSAGTENPSAGRTSALHLRISRDDDDEELKSVTVNMPNGLTGKIANVDLCPEAAAKTGACSEGSRVGRVTVGAGAGPNPFYIDAGRAYLTGPYKGAPYGLSIVVPAVAGPFDLGNVVVRSSIFVDKHTAELRVISDPLPRILQGIPLDVRDVRVDVDRKDFILNPTSCAKKTVSGVLGSVDGQTAAVSSRFQAADCASLAFKPRMALSVGSVGHTGRNATVPLSTTLTMPSGNANLRYVRVRLPKTINARLTVINRACTRAQYETGKCEAARAGTAEAKTPLLRRALRGNVYFVKNGHPLPDLFIALRGEVDFDLIGRISIPQSTYLATTFDSIPDVPVKSFTLKLFPGAKGTVGAATNLCTASARAQMAELDYIGQNGRVQQIDQKLKINGCGKKAKRGKGAGHRR